MRTVYEILMFNSFKSYEELCNFVEQNINTTTYKKYDDFSLNISSYKIINFSDTYTVEGYEYSKGEVTILNKKPTKNDIPLILQYYSDKDIWRTKERFRGSWRCNLQGDAYDIHTISYEESYTFDVNELSLIHKIQNIQLVCVLNIYDYNCKQIGALSYHKPPYMRYPVHHDCKNNQCYIDYENPVYSKDRIEWYNESWWKKYYDR